MAIFGEASVGAFYGVVLVILIGLAFIPATIAKNKGYSFALFYALGILFFLITLIVSLVLPKKAGAPGSVIGGQATCPFCAHPIDPRANFCAACGKDQPKRPCPRCQQPITRTATLCTWCSTASPPWQLYQGRWFSKDPAGTEYVLSADESGWEPTGRVLP